MKYDPPHAPFHVRVHHGVYIVHERYGALARVESSSAHVVAGVLNALENLEAAEQRRAEEQLQAFDFTGAPAASAEDAP